MRWTPHAYQPGDASLWFDVSGPSVVPQVDMTAERPVLVAVHGGPGLDHMTVKSVLEPLADDFQVLYFDLRGHGRPAAQAGRRRGFPVA
jgi:proline iminopeptidase